MPHTPETHPGGTWVPHDAVALEANVEGRAYRLADGTEGVYRSPLQRQSPITHWYFAPEE